MALPRLLLIVAVAAPRLPCSSSPAAAGPGRDSSQLDFRRVGERHHRHPGPERERSTVADAPVLDAPAESYTNQPSGAHRNRPGRRRRQHRRPDPDLRRHRERRVGADHGAPRRLSKHLLVPDLKLSEGTNIFQATFIGADDRESERSAACGASSTRANPKSQSSLRRTRRSSTRSPSRSSVRRRRVAAERSERDDEHHGEWQRRRIGAFAIVVPLGRGPTRSRSPRPIRPEM